MRLKAGGIQFLMIPANSLSEYSTKMVPTVSVEMAKKVSQLQLLAESIQLTRDMLDNAKEGNWSAVSDHELLRREALRLCFDSAVTVDDSEVIAEALAVILHLNEELVSLLQRARQGSLEASRANIKLRGAVDSYHELLNAKV